MIDIVSSVQQFAPTLFSIDNSKLMESRRVALEEIDKQNLAAQNAASQLSSVIGALDFHESQQPYKAELVNQYDSMVNDALEKYGTLRFAMNDIMAKSRELSTSPEVLGRIKTNEQYKEWEKSIEERKDISQDVKDYTIATNPYKFELKEEVVRDSNGNVVLNEDGTEKKKVVGYKDFKGADPTAQYSNLDINKNIMAVLNPDVTSGSSIKMYYTDAYGNRQETTDFNKAEYYIDRSGREEKLSDGKIANAVFLTLNDPQIDASLRQDYKVSAYKYKNGERFLLNGNNYHINENEQIVDENGKAISPTEYEILRLKDIAKTYGYTKYISEARWQQIREKLVQGSGINPEDLSIGHQPTQAGVVEVNPTDAVYVAPQVTSTDFVRQKENENADIWRDIEESSKEPSQTN